MSVVPATPRPPPQPRGWDLRRLDELRLTSANFLKLKWFSVRGDRALSGLFSTYYFLSNNINICEFVNNTYTMLPKFLDLPKQKYP